MNKFAALLLVAVSLLVSFGLNSKNADRNQTAFINTTSTPKSKLAAKIERVELDRSVVVIPCPPIFKKTPSEFDSPCFNDNGLVNVKTVVNNPRSIPLNYQYKVSGGRITGQGENVIWDLTGTRPGTYQISATIDEGRGFITESTPLIVEIKDVCCCISCTCPDFSITANETVRTSESLVFLAEVSGGTVTDITYNWTISQGEIVNGQGTPQIKVRTTQEMTGDITATVEIGGAGLCEQCPRTMSKTVTLTK